MQVNRPGKTNSIYSSGRKNPGSALALTGALGFVLVSVGMFFVFFVGLIGGTREVQQAVDSGNLTVATSALDVPFVFIDEKSTPARQQFLPFSRQGRVSLRNINSIMAFELITQANLKSMRDRGLATQLAEENARLLSDEAEKIAAELAAMLKVQANFKETFESVAKQNSLRLLPGHDRSGVELTDHQVSYVNRGEASNVSFDYQQVPANVRSLFKENESRWFKNIGGRLFFRGYTDGIQINGRQIHFVPLFEPGNSGGDPFGRSFPHLISGKDFASNKEPASGKASFNWQDAIPNAFLNQGTALLVQSSQQQCIAHSSAVANDIMVRPAFPHGFIKIINPRGYNPVTRIPANDSIFNNELMSGIFLAKNALGKTVCFSTDQEALEKLIEYNRNPDLPLPAVLDQDGNPLYFDQLGNPVDDLSKLSSAAALGSSCTCTNTLPSPGSSPEPACADSLAAFFQAYPHAGAVIPTGEGAKELLSVEEARHQIFISAREAHKTWSVLCAQGYSPQQANVKGLFPSIRTIAPYFSGLRKFDNNSIQASLNTPRMIYSEAGTVDDYFHQVSLAQKPSVFQKLPADIAGFHLEQSSFDRSDKPDPRLQARVDLVWEALLERVNQISPETTMSDLKNLLKQNSQTLQLGSELYISFDSQEKKLKLSPTAPSWISQFPLLGKSVQRCLADGKPDLVKSNDYHLLDCVVNAPGDNAHDVFFYVNPSWQATAISNDLLLWTPNTGCNGLLGTVEFRNYCYNQNDVVGEFYQPN